MKGIIVFAGITAIIFVVKYFNYKKQLLDRIALNPEEVKILGNIKTGNETLRWGLLFIGIALGFVLGAFFYKFSLFDDQIFAYLTGIFLSGGIALLVGYFIENKK
ncbi:MAG: hypothetical protein CSB03_00935 [Bacteroidia bacterium]|nr:MAG: hypothetical protein CSB03_00935 [Bacteroidia bacterium]